MEYIYKANTDLNASFGAGFLEDIIPFMSNIYTTQRLRKALALADDFFAFLTKLVKQHEETFDSSKIYVVIFSHACTVNLVCQQCNKCNNYVIISNDLNDSSLFVKYKDNTFR